MKKLLIFLCATFVFVIAKAQTVNWYVDDALYQTTTCTAGDTITPPTVPTRYGYTLTSWEERSYTPIEYLEFTGTQWIDTGVYGNLYTSHTIVFQYNPNGFTDSRFNGSVVFGSRESATSKSIFILVEKEDKVFTDFGNYLVTRLDATEDFSQKIEIYNSKDRRYIKGLGTGNIYNSDDQYTINFLTPSTLEIGHKTTNMPMNSTNFFGYIYSCKIWQDNTLVRDLVPVLDLSGTPCMYDKVTGQFFYNAGTGQFIAGPVLNE